LFEMRDRDAFGRSGELRTAHGRIRTPTVLPVIDPVRQSIPAAEILESTDASALITNAYLIYRDPALRRRVLEVGIHRHLGVDCPIATDSGGYQIYRGGKVRVSPEEIHRFQAEIGSDMAVVLDVPPRDGMDLENARSCVRESVMRSRSLIAESPEGPLWYGVVHLSPHARLRRWETGAIGGMPFDLFALGSCVGSLVEYRFESHIDRAIDVAKRLPPDRPRHVFGVGHPMFLAVSSAFGGDIFDSAMYALSAQGGRYLTPNGTLRVGDLRELPCSCPVCTSAAPSELVGDRGVDLLARHNLHATFEELRRVRQAISDGRLWELVQLRCRGHPKILGAFASGLRKHGTFLETVDPITKRSALFYSGPESGMRPEVTRARRQVDRLGELPSFKHPLYGRVPLTLAGCYPFGQTVMPDSMERRIEDNGRTMQPDAIVRGALDFQFTSGCGSAMEPFEVISSRRTGRIRSLSRGDETLGAFRARDFLFLPSIKGALILKDQLAYPRFRITVEEEAVPFVADGKSVFAKFVAGCDGDLVPGQEVLVVDREDRLLGVATSMMNCTEASTFRVGVAARVRHGVGRESLGQ
jgi:7-cyano-7-deazaguanine tRNA-ribosyltransferase